MLLAYGVALGKLVCVYTLREILLEKRNSTLLSYDWLRVCDLVFNHVSPCPHTFTFRVCRLPEPT